MSARAPFKVPTAHDRGPYPVPFGASEILMGAIMAAITFVVTMPMPAVAAVVLAAGLSVLPLTHEREREQWTWTAWFGAVLGSGVGAGVLTAAAVFQRRDTAAFSVLVAVVVADAATGVFLVRNLPNQGTSRRTRLAVVCGGSLAAVAGMLGVLLVAARSAGLDGPR